MFQGQERDWNREYDAARSVLWEHVSRAEAALREALVEDNGLEIRMAQWRRDHARVIAERG